MKKRLWAWMLCACMLLCGCTALSETAQQAAEPEMLIEVEYKKSDLDSSWEEKEVVRIVLNKNRAQISGEGAVMTGNVLLIDEEGDYLLSGELNGRILIDAGKNDKVRLILNGAALNSTDSAAIFALKADKVTVTLAEGSENIVAAGKNLLVEDDEELDAAIYSKADLVINGEGSLNVSSPDYHGILSKDDLRIISGDITVNAHDDGVRGRDALLVYGGTLTVAAGNDGLKANNDEDADKGYISIDGGKVTVSAGDDGIKAETSMQIRGGEVNVAESYEALEAQYLLISGGTLSLTSSDDGINAAGGDEEAAGGRGRFSMGGGHQTLRISGGTVYVDASGDGIDSNGTVEFAGGEVYVSGPVSSGNSALDSDSEMLLSGGVLIAAGSSAMAGAPSSDVQPVTMIFVESRQTGGERVSIRNGAGEELAVFTPNKDWSSIVISVPELETGERFEIYVGDAKLIDAEAGTGGRGGFGGQPPRGGMGFPPQGAWNPGGRGQR